MHWGLAAMIVLGLLRSGVCAAPPAAPAPVETAAQRTTRMGWGRDAKFGLFIHWGLYAVPAGRWKGKHQDGIGEWIMQNQRIPVDEYAALARQFNPVKFDAAAWAAMARDAGMK